MSGAVLKNISFPIKIVEWKDNLRVLKEKDREELTWTRGYVRVPLNPEDEVTSSPNRRIADVPAC